VLFFAALAALVALSVWSAFQANHVQSAIDMLENSNRSNRAFAASFVTNAEDWYAIVQFLKVIVVIVMVGFWIWWLRRATANLASFGAIDASFGTGWAVGGWFVPILALWRPLEVMNQAWRGSSLANATAEIESSSWKFEPVNPLMIVGWLAFIWYWFTSQLASNLYFGADTYADGRGYLTAAVWLDLANVVALLFVANIVREITARHGAKDASLNVKAD
jgi:hypothetical protein